MSSAEAPYLGESAGDLAKGQTRCPSREGWLGRHHSLPLSLALGLFLPSCGLTHSSCFLTLWQPLLPRLQKGTLPLPTQGYCEKRPAQISYSQNQLGVSVLLPFGEHQSAKSMAF